MRKIILLSVLMLFIASCGIIPPPPNGGGEMGSIEIGYSNPTSSGISIGLDETYDTVLITANPSAGDGTITSIALAVNDDIDNLVVGIFEKNGEEDEFKVKDYTTVDAKKYTGESTIVSVKLDVRIGDYIGVVIPVESKGTFFIHFDEEGELGLWTCLNDNNVLDGNYHEFQSDEGYFALALKGIGVEVEYAPPKLEVLPPTNILESEVKAHGNIVTDYFKTVTERGFQYGLTKDNLDEKSEQSIEGFELGEFSLTIDELEPKTTYWIRAYAENSEGTGYSDWIQFQTAAKGIIPTGIKLNICSDYSGYTYQLMRSELDDGEIYTAHFNIATDLASNQGLPYYKRILDLNLYFNKETEGDCKVYVKCDNEPEWQYVGEVSLEGDEDIIIRHIPTDIRGKHFQFKLEADNHFEFLGMLVEYLPQGKR